MTRSRLIILPLFSKLRLVTDSATPSYLELDVPEFRPMLPHAEKLFLYSTTHFTTTNMRWNVELVPGNDRDNEASAVSLASADFSAVGPRVDQYSGTYPYMLEGRLRIRYQNSTGTAVNSALVSGSIGVLTFGT